MLYLKSKKYYSVLCVYEMTYNTQKKKCIFVIKSKLIRRTQKSGVRDQVSGFRRQGSRLTSLLDWPRKATKHFANCH